MERKDLEIYLEGCMACPLSIYKEERNDGTLKKDTTKIICTKVNKEIVGVNVETDRPNFCQFKGSLRDYFPESSLSVQIAKEESESEDEKSENTNYHNYRYDGTDGIIECILL